MGISQFFISRPIFATVLCVLTVIVGGIAYTTLPVEEYPGIAPPSVEVSAAFPGASADVLARTIAPPLEQEINGVEGMLYLSSQSTNDGRLTISVTFDVGTDLDMAQVAVQNRVAAVLPKLPEAVRAAGVTTTKKSPDLMMVVNLFSPQGTYDQGFMANYATLQLVDKLERIPGVGFAPVFGGGSYAMRVWLNPERMAALSLSAEAIYAKIRSQNAQVAAGQLNSAPTQTGEVFQFSIQTKGRLTAVEEFENIVLKTTPTGKIIHLKDVARIEIGADTYSMRGNFGDKMAVAIPIFQRPGSNALATADAIKDIVQEAAKDFPPDLDYAIAYNPTEFVRSSINAVFFTILEAIVLVIIVMVLFLQNWRAAIIPVVAIPVSMIGTFAIMAWMGLSLNTLTLFGLVLAIGIVVDDAIVVVENMERLLSQGMRPLQAARETMRDVGKALVAMGLVLVAVFFPTLFLGGISGAFFKQFGLTVSIATVLSVLVSLILSPAMGCLLLRPHKSAAVRLEAAGQNPLSRLYLGGLVLFERMIAGLETFYHSLTTKVLTMPRRMLALYSLGVAVAGGLFFIIPQGFIPPQDQGYFIIGAQLPPAATLDRTQAVSQEIIKTVRDIKGVKDIVSFVGFSGATFSSASNAAAFFPVLEDFETRRASGQSYARILGEMRQRLMNIKEAFVIVIPPPPVRGIGSGGGFKMMIQDKAGLGYDALHQTVWQMIGAAQAVPSVANVFSFFDVQTPEIYVDIDREKAAQLLVPLEHVFQALSIFLGSAYVNDFNMLGRAYKVIVSNDSPYRRHPDNIAHIQVQSATGHMVPLGAFVSIKQTTGPSLVPRYNLLSAAAIQGDTAVSFSTGTALKDMEALAKKILPPGLIFSWTEMALQQSQDSNVGLIAFVMAALFVFMLLAAQYESLVLPVAILLIIPMCLLSALVGVWATGQDVNLMTQLGLVVLIALACKNAILIVEFAKQNEEKGMNRWDAAISAAHIRMRPIIMTSLAFILGVVPLVFSTGAGAEMRHAIGVTVFFGMLGVTLCGLIFTPLFYVLCRRVGDRLGIA